MAFLSALQIVLKTKLMHTYLDILANMANYTIIFCPSALIAGHTQLLKIYVFGEFLQTDLPVSEVARLTNESYFIDLSSAVRSIVPFHTPLF